MSDLSGLPVARALPDAPAARELGLLLRIEEVDTIGKSIAFLVQEILLKGFDAISHADLAARIALILEAMPSARPLVLGMQFALLEEDFALALDHARLLVEREQALMALALAAADSAPAQP
ncbi:flagellar biosynthesis repressor FlbT [Phreatobacter sp.]|uniref:flagellar biosynthesis repressor FlbT n=1 Tax=Phreatobacter sp. TaxID=1966341 RepID=UPI0025E753BA|nr:flagellar biosynthesis repressor FlbT [Phreatobacter sp.]